MLSRRLGALAVLLAPFAFCQDVNPDPGPSIPLTVPAGLPLRLYLTKRTPKRVGAPVEARLLTPVYAFDREVIPAGMAVTGRVSETEPVPKWDRARSILAGDFTPLRIARVEFTSIAQPDGRLLKLETVSSPGLNSLVPLHPKKVRTPPDPQGGIVATGKQKAQEKLDTQLDRIRSIPEIVRGPNRMEWLTDFLLAKLPYHPQYIRSRTRFDAELAGPLEFGSTIVTDRSLALFGSQPPTGSIVHARLLTSIDSRNSVPGDKVGAVLDEPLFSPDHKLILPEGTHISGSVVLSKPAGWFHRGGRLRFSFQSVEVPELALLRQPGIIAPPVFAQRTLQFRTQAVLSAAESGRAPLKVDEEGGVQATESKTRFIGALVSLAIVRRAADNDVRRSSTGAVTGQSSNTGGRGLGGGMGFGLLGSIAAQSSRSFGTALSYYGMAWSLFSTIVARGKEVTFDKNAVVDISFNPRAPRNNAPKPNRDAAPAK